MFIRESNEHSYPPESCLVTTSKVSKLIQEASEIVEEVMLENIDSTMPIASLLAPVNLARQANKVAS